ncbi:MAG TPA: methyltransferase domain-containing protein [Mycobacteriales bacterium]|nr:methyltransferase domain-containing protein [Mycobacteriales bacterium]
MATSDELRSRLVERLVAGGTIVTANVRRALAAVPRERFVPEVDLTEAYADAPVALKRGRTGRMLSTVSQPTMVATMLEMLRVEAGQRVLEIGTGSGYNAALLAELVGPKGSVVSVEVEADLTERASAALAATGYAERVQTHTADGAAGWSADAPYDRIIATVGVGEIPRPWVDQLRVGGWLVAPVVDGKGRGTTVAYQRRPDGIQPHEQVPCGFLVMR